MDTSSDSARIAEAVAKYGNAWSPEVNEAMKELFEGLHIGRVKSFEGKVGVEKGVKYGDDERHRVDLYYPIGKGEGENKSLPVIVYFHGGAFVMGDNDISPSMHGHIGRYFATNGCICAFATYRLLPSARYPSGAEDVAQALQWLDQNISRIGGNPSNVTAIGQSAGGAHLATSIFTGKLGHLGIRIKGAVLLSAPLSYNLGLERRRKNMFAYHSTEIESEVLAKTSVATFRSASQKDLDCCDGNFLVLLAEFDFDEIVDGNLLWVEAYRERMGRLPVVEVMKGQNHVSSCLGIGLEGNVLGPRILRFVRAES